MFRANQICIIPRYESEDLDIGIKAGLVEYQLPVLGLSVRYKSIRAGAEVITALTFNSMFGAGLHLGISLHNIQGVRKPDTRF